LLAHFGYGNDNSTKASVPTGEDNKLSPGARGRGQPTSFETGRISDSLSVTFQDTSSISWRLRKNSASANIAPKRCQGYAACIDANIKPLLAGLDDVSRQEKATVYIISNRTSKLDKSAALTTKAQGYKTQAHKLNVEQWTEIWPSFG